jgi:hypothetical protein
MTKVYGSLSLIKLVSYQTLLSFSWMSLFTVSLSKKIGLRMGLLSRELLKKGKGHNLILTQ